METEAREEIAMGDKWVQPIAKMEIVTGEQPFSTEWGAYYGSEESDGEDGDAQMGCLFCSVYVEHGRLLQVQTVEAHMNRRCDWGVEKTVQICGMCAAKIAELWLKEREYEVKAP